MYKIKITLSGIVKYAIRVFIDRSNVIFCVQNLQIINCFLNALSFTVRTFYMYCPWPIMCIKLTSSNTSIVPHLPQYCKVLPKLLVSIQFNSIQFISLKPLYGT